MTSGEKINYYRKQLGLSQEELGQKLLVSRQTISLWEKDQTVPTIDNLIRLKEIFGVSVDEILGCAEEKEAERDLSVAKESYVFRYTKEELNVLYKQSNKQLISRIILFAVIGVAFLIWAFFEEEGQWFLGLGAGVMLLSMIITIKTFSVNKTNSKKTIERLPKASYDVKVYDNYFTVKVIRDNETKGDFKFDFNDIEQFLDYGEYLYVTANGITVILRKSELVQNSVFTLLSKSSPEKTVVNKKGMTTKQSMLNLLFVATLFSLLIPMPVISLISSDAAGFFNYLWIFYLITPIPVISIILGIIYKRKGYKCKKNIVAGIIMLILMCIYGSMGFTIEDEADHSDAAIIKAEEVIGIDIPEAAYIDTFYWEEEEEQSFNRGYIYSSSDISFNEDVADAFEAEIYKNPKWMEKIPSDLYGLTSSLTEYYDGSFLLLYNADTKEFNTVPKKNGTYHFFSLGYDVEYNTMQINEYDIEYVK